MMHSKSFERLGDKRDRPEESRKVERLFPLVDGNDRGSLSDRRKKMQTPGKIENVRRSMPERER